MNRCFVFLSAAAAFLLTGVLRAEPLNPSRVVFSYPDRQITSIQDQPMTMPGTLFQSVDPKERFHPASRYAASLNVFLIQYRNGSKPCLIDAGYGKPGSRLLKQLAEINVKPEEIAAVFITHIHPDHVGGLTTASGEKAFPNARLCIARKEYESWVADTRRAALSKHLIPYQKQLMLMDYDCEVAPYGLTPLLYAGHTPGHTVYRMTLPAGSASDLYFVGDIVHAAELQIPRSSFCAKFDQEPEKAVASRRELLAAGRIWFGAHLPFPGKITVRPPRSERDLYGFQPDDGQKTPKHNQKSH